MKWQNPQNKDEQNKVKFAIFFKLFIGKSNHFFYSNHFAFLGGL